MTAGPKNQNLVVRNHAAKAHKKTYKRCIRRRLGNNAWKTVDNQPEYGCNRNPHPKNCFRKQKNLVNEKNHEEKQKADKKIDEKFFCKIFCKNVLFYIVIVGKLFFIQGSLFLIINFSKMIQAKDKSSLKAAKAIIRNANPDSIQSYIAQRINCDSVTYVKVQHGLWELGKNSAVDKYGFKAKNAEFTPNEALPIVECVGKKLKAPEAWNDEKGKVTTDYQDFLEAEWIKRLREKYPVEIKDAVWQRIKK